MREQIIKKGVANLKEYGYPHVTIKNILTDEVYKAFFISMLEDNLNTPNSRFNNACAALLSELKH